MKIIKPSKVGDTLTGECKSCGCIVECAKNESEYLQDSHENYVYGIRCPTCIGKRYIFLKVK